MTKYEVYSYEDSFKVDIALITAQFSGLGDQISAPDFAFTEINYTEEWMAEYHPLGRVPALKTPYGGLFESNSICRFLAREGNDKGLYGTNNYEASKIDAWMDLIADFVGAKIFDLYGFVYPLWQHPYNKEKFDDAVEVSKKMWALIDKQLSKHKYLINDRVTLADIILAGYYKNPLKYSLGKDFRSQFPKVEAYFAGLYNLKEFKNAIGEIKFVEKLEL